MATALRMSKKRKFVADGVFYCELNELMGRLLTDEGFAGVEVKKTPNRTELIIRATRVKAVLGDNGQRIRELTAIVQQRFGLKEGKVELYVERVMNRGLCAMAQVESLKYKLMEGLAVRRACYGIVRFVMESGARGCEVSVSGKARTQRAQAMRFRDGYMVKTGQPRIDYQDVAKKHVLMRSGVCGLKVIIMLPYDPTGRNGPKIPQPDVIIVHEPKEEEILEPTPQGEPQGVPAVEVAEEVAVEVAEEVAVEEPTE
jgi:small subunit ribosomal protein S3e